MRLEVMYYLGDDGKLHDYFGDVGPTPPNPKPLGTPNAQIIVSDVTFLRLVFSGTQSTEGTPGATIASYLWTFGDGGTSTAAAPTHTYATPGIYPITLTVADSTGATDTDTVVQVVSAQAGNVPPVAAFTVAVSGLAVTVNASASSDSDGTIIDYAWDFGDGGAANGVSAGHSYSTGGTRTISLTVTDSGGATTTLNKSVTTSSVIVAPPTVALTSVVNTGMSVTIDGTVSDPNGDTVTLSIDWGDTSTVNNASLPASHTYAALGPWTVVVTATNSHGASSQVSASASPSAGTNTPYRNDDGLGTANGLEPTTASAGVPLVSYNALAGADVVARAKAAGSTVMSLPPGSFTVPGFSSTSATTATATAGMIGAGSAQSTLSQVPNSSANAPVGSNVMRLTATNGFLEDFAVVGTQQTVAPYNTWNGIHLNGDNWTIRRLKLQGIAPGNDKAPPGETFGINLFKAYGSILIEDVEIDGQGIGASNLGTNGSGSDATVPTMFLTVNRMYTHGNHYSGGFALWQTKFDARSAFNDCVFDDSRCFWNVERCSGTVTLNRPRIGRLKAATTGWDPTTNKSIPGPVGIFCESGNTWGTAASQNFRFIVRDPRNLDGTPYNGPKITINFGSSFVNSTSTKETNFYGSTNFRCFNAAGTDISSSFFSYGLGGFN